MVIEYLAGTSEVTGTVLPPYAEEVCNFLDDLSTALRKDTEARAYPDVQTFAFWCRRANIRKLKIQYQQDEKITRFGKGTIFHIAPSNVPINAGFSYVIGLLAGNSNVIRVSTKRHPQVMCLCRILEQLFENPSYKKIQGMTSFITYEPDSEITDLYSSACAMRIIWGGDKTIEEIRKSPLSPRSTEITFADRFSIGVIEGSTVEEATDEEMKKLAQDFYHDTYLMDQNACSTPHLIFWKNGTERAKEKFWSYVYEASKSYDLSEQKVSDKYAFLCEQVAYREEILSIKRYDNLLYVADLKRDEMSQDAQAIYRGIFGLFYQTDIEVIEQIFSFVDERTQTCAVFGISADEIREAFMTRATRGLDRIVPFGKTLDIGVYWDGYDLIRSLSRCINWEG